MLKTWLFMALMLLVPLNTAAAHHVLGRPAYSLNEDSNTPPSMQGEARIGNYMLTYMIFPAFPRPGEPGRIHLYATTIEGSEPFAGKVSFSLRADSWRGTRDGVALGVQPPDDHVYRQGLLIEQAGDYMVTARVEVDGEPFFEGSGLDGLRSWLVRELDATPREVSLRIRRGGKEQMLLATLSLQPF